MKIAGREIGSGQPPYIVAEISCNHGGSLERAFQLIRAAKIAGADAVKFQAYTADTITLDCSNADFFIEDGPWKGQRLYDLYKQCETPFEWFPRLFQVAKAEGVACFASVFDKSAVDLLESLDCPAYKIASFELTDLPLIRYAAGKRKPMILSLGMASDYEFREASEASDAAFGNRIFLACMSSYPVAVEESNLWQLRHWTNCMNGVSDHSIGIEVPIAATACGAWMIEKHFTLSRRRATADSLFSSEPAEFQRMCEAVRNVWKAMQPSKVASEKAHRPLRRSLYAVADIKAGETFTHENVRSIRPGFGLPPKELDAIIGASAARDIGRGTPLSWALLQAPRAKAAVHE